MAELPGPDLRDAVTAHELVAPVEPAHGVVGGLAVLRLVEEAGEQEHALAATELREPVLERLRADPAVLVVADYGVDVLGREDDHVARPRAILDRADGGL